jgi:hypothetical protein
VPQVRASERTGLLSQVPQHSYTKGVFTSRQLAIVGEIISIERRPRAMPPLTDPRPKLNRDAKASVDVVIAKSLL